MNSFWIPKAGDRANTNLGKCTILAVDNAFKESAIQHEDGTLHIVPNHRLTPIIESSDESSSVEENIDVIKDIQALVVAINDVREHTKGKPLARKGETVIRKMTDKYGKGEEDGNVERK